MYVNKSVYAVDAEFECAACVAERSQQAWVKLVMM